MRRPDSVLLVTALGFAFAAPTASAMNLPVALRAAIVLPLVAYLTGATLWSAIFPNAPRTLEAHVLSAATSLAITALCGLVLNLIHWLTPGGWAVALASFTIIGSIVALCRRQLAVPGHAAIAPRIRLLSGNNLAFGAAALLTVASFLLARQGALAQREFNYTEFWMVAAPGDHPSSATLGLTNAEQTASSYAVEILAAQKVVDRWPAVVLEPGETRTTQIALPQDPDGQRVEARLYKDGDERSVYRKVWIAVPPLDAVEKRRAETNAPKRTATSRTSADEANVQQEKD